MVHRAVAERRHLRFAHRVAAELTRLQSEPTAWAAYLAEREATALADGPD